MVLGFVVLVPTMGPKPYLQRGKAGRKESRMAPEQGGSDGLSVYRVKGLLGNRTECVTSYLIHAYSLSGLLSLFGWSCTHAYF